MAFSASISNADTLHDHRNVALRYNSVQLYVTVHTLRQRWDLGLGISSPVMAALCLTGAK